MSKPTADQMEQRWKKIQKMQGYTDEELAIFRANPSYVKVVEGAPMFLTHRIIAVASSLQIKTQNIFLTSDFCEY